jgi:diaminopimelate decarboxylase
MTNNFRTNFLSAKQASKLAREHGTPLFVYSKAALEAQAQAMLSVPAPHGLTIRYAMKANPHPEILRILRGQGVKIDASSGYEAEAALASGYAADDILLTSQQLAHNLRELVEQGVHFNATSLRQLEAYGQAFPGSKVSVRLNPGIGSGHSAKVTVGGSNSSFGIWHEYIPQVRELARRYGLTIERLHTHIGAGTEPAVWRRAAQISLDLIKQFPEAPIVNLGGGFKVARTDDEHDTHIDHVEEAIVAELGAFQRESGRQLHLELEPGTFMAANAGILIAAVEDIVDTGPEGHNFLKLNTGMNDILRPSYYGAQHPIALLSDSSDEEDYVVVGHNCESADLLTPAPGEPDVLQARRLPGAAIGDLVLIGGTGAYCAAMAAHGYNGFPSAKEVVV